MKDMSRNILSFCIIETHMGTVLPIFKTIFCLSQLWFVFTGKGNVTNESSQVIHFNKLFDAVTLEPMLLLCPQRLTSNDLEQNRLFNMFSFYILVLDMLASTSWSVELCKNGKSKLMLAACHSSGVCRVL